jgi:hypothetical protein
MREGARRAFMANCGLALAACALGRRTAKAEAWTNRGEYGPFQCVAAFPLTSLENLFTELSQLEQELERTLAVGQSGEKIEIRLFADAPSYREYLNKLYPRAPYRRALYVQRAGRGVVYAYRHEQLPIDLRHECTHALLHSSLPGVPLWLDEGLAEYFEMPEALRAYGHPHLASLRWDLRLGRRQSIPSLENRRDLSEMGPMEYRFSWAWVHFMLHGPILAHKALVQYLADSRLEGSPGHLSRRLEVAMPELDARMTQHFLRWRRPQHFEHMATRKSFS